MENHAAHPPAEFADQIRAPWLDTGEAEILYPVIVERSEARKIFRSEAPLCADAVAAEEGCSARQYLINAYIALVVGEALRARVLKIIRFSRQVGQRDEFVEHPP